MGLKENYKYWKITNKGGFIKFVFHSRAFLIMLLFFVAICIGLGGGLFLAVVTTTQELENDDLEFKNLSSIFYDKDGKEIVKVFGYQNRIVVRLNEMSQYLPNAFIAIEDERFREHGGIDIKRSIGAAINYIIPGGKQYGGSTITQQLIKNITNEREVSIKRKLQEQIRAIMLEQKLSKDQIIELYLNTIFLGQDAYGVETAARTYFDKEAKDLTIAESAMLAGITQSPSRRNPITDFQASKERQELVLAKMKEQGFITEQQYNEASNDKIKIKKGKVVKVARQSYFIDAVCEQVLSDLQSELGIEKKRAQEMLFNEGLLIDTTMDSKVQEAIDEAYSPKNSVFAQFSGKSVQPQSAMVVMDYTNGYVVGLCGGYGPKTGVMTFNRAVHLKRQPGSSIKPIAVYGPALDMGLITPATVIDDVPIRIGNWSPRNSYKDGFRGLSTIRRAITDSMNVVAVKVWMKVGPDRSYDFLNNLGLNKLAGQDKYLPEALALGGLTEGVSPLKMAAAYTAIANGGYYSKPILYTKVKDKNGKVLLEKKQNLTKVMDERAAYILTDMMKNAVNEGTGGSAKLQNMPAAGKTGTTSENVDRWFVGFTPYYVGAAWFGYENDDGRKRSIPGSANYSAKIWKTVMEKAHKNLPVKDFVEPSGIITANICIDSGLLPGEYCSHDPRGNRVRKEKFIQGTEPTEICKTHLKVNICSDSKKIATVNCPPEKVTSVIRIQRLEPYTPIDSSAPLPKDAIYEAPKKECDIHTGY
ncbi:MAG: transglycosylase domain-containing protein [Deltaproteobacteria bacterium]